MTTKLSLTVTLTLVNERDSAAFGQVELASVPEIGSQVMYLNREWEIWEVTGVRHWPANPDFRREPRVDVYAKYCGELPLPDPA